MSKSAYISSAAEARDAYVAGFCKAAEAMGVDPVKLAKVAADDSTHAIGNSRLESAGRYTSAATAALIGSLLAGKRLRGAGALAGLGTGVLGNLGGSLAAAVTPTRSASSQISYDSALHILKNLLIPSVGSYNRAKRIEREAVHKWHS